MTATQTCPHGVRPKHLCKKCKSAYDRKFKTSPKGRAVVNASMRRYYHYHRHEWWETKPVRMRFRSILHGARRRKQCDLVEDDLLLLWEKQHGRCAYCGTEMTYERGGRKPTTVSIDRIDSSEGYTVSNVVLACTACNLGKGQMTVEEFLEHCRRVVNFAGVCQMPHGELSHE